MKKLILFLLFLVLPLTAQTYSTTATISPAASATDIFTITGSSSRTIHITNVSIGCTQTTSGIINVILLKRSTADTAGTSTNPTKVPLDSTNTAASATVAAYTANPTPGTLVGNLKTYNINCLSTSATSPSDIIIQNFGAISDQNLVLRGTGEVFAINLNAVTVTGGSFDINVEWTEQ